MTITDIRTFMTQATTIYAKKIANLDEINVVFSSGMRRTLGWCNKNKRLIKYNLIFCELNKDNPEALINLVIHETCHLVHPNHSRNFKNLCRQHGLIGNGRITEQKGNRNLIFQQHKYFAYCPSCDEAYVRHRKQIGASCGICSDSFNPSTILHFKKIN